MLSLKRSTVVFEKSSVALNGKQLERHTAHNVAVYFIRLPDGNPEGTGYTAQPGQSLKYLHAGKTTNLSTVDDANVYMDWNDLIRTIHEIVNFESSDTDRIVLHSTDSSPEHSPNDHSDHYLCGTLASDVFNLKTSADLHFYTGYDIARRSVNLVLPDLLLQVAVWGVTNSAIVDAGLPSAFDEIHNQWLGKNYSRSIENGTSKE